MNSSKSKYMQTSCKHCGTGFLKKKSNQLYCDRKCRGAANTATALQATSGIDASTGTVGAIAELRIAAELMAQGFECYRALSAASSADLVALKDGMAYRFEVRSAVRTLAGGITYPNKNVRCENIALFIHRESISALLPESPVPIEQPPKISEASRLDDSLTFRGFLQLTKEVTEAYQAYLDKMDEANRNHWAFAEPWPEALQGLTREDIEILKL